MKVLDLKDPYSHIIVSFIALLLLFSIGVVKVAPDFFKSRPSYSEIDSFIHWYGPQAAAGAALALGVAGSIILWHAGKSGLAIAVVSGWVIAPVVALCFLVLAHIYFNRIDAQSN